MSGLPADYFDKPIDDAIVDGLLHLPIRGKELQMAAYQVRLSLRNAGYEVRKSVVPAPHKPGVEP